MKKTSPYIELTNGKPRIEKAKAFCHLLHGKLPALDTSFTALFPRLDRAVLRESKRIGGTPVTREALSNAHGDWYEWLIAIAAWNYRIKSQRTIAAFLLPSVSQFDVVSLYNKRLGALVQDLRSKVGKVKPPVRLITSNPDFVLVNLSRISLPGIDINKKIATIDENSVRLVTTAYSALEGRFDFDGVVGYASVKVSFRPDRRLQVPHEGSLMKAIYAHLQTRNWVIKPKGLRFYAMAAAVNDKDVAAMETIATHSITDVNVTPQRAVDDLLVVNSLRAAKTAFRKILA